VITGALSINNSTEDERASNFFNNFRKLSIPFKNLLIQSIAVNSTAFENEENGQRIFINNKIETALLNLTRDHLDIYTVIEKHTNTEIIQLIPFNSSKKYIKAVIRLLSNNYRLVVKEAA